MANKKAQLFQYAILWHPSDKEQEDGRKTEIIVDIDTVLATSEQAAVLLAGKQIPEDRVDDIDQMEVVVRPF